MKIIHHFPRTIREIENCWIPMPDGARLAARIWLPDDAEHHPVPAVVEYIPYRKRAGTPERDEPIHRYLAGHGYAGVRVDVRGSGESDGVLLDEYTEQEHADGVAAISWIARQPWCDGGVGLMGKSWGGFNALQLAALAPQELKAVITVCASDDRYADDAHYMGGCLLNENLIWGSVLFTLAAQPPDPKLVGDRWREMWLERLHHVPLPIETWLQHPHRDEYWKRGSVCDDFSRIRCPVYAIGGWADGYTNAVPRLLAGLHGPRKGLVGPWAHVYPHEGVPGPAIGFLQEALRWWDHWLKGIDSGIMDEPLYRVWMQEGVSPRSFYDRRPGRWVSEDTWPSPRTETLRLAMNWRRLEERPGTLAPIEHRSPQTVGLGAGSWCGFGIEGDMPLDQREDDGKSLTFDSRPIQQPLEILGAPVVTLALAVDRPVALLAVRLNDVGPDDSVTRVSYGLLNLTHYTGHERPEPLVPGRRYAVAVPLNHVAHHFAEGHRLRVAVSTTYWPIAWPSPEPVTLTLFVGESHVELPVRSPRETDARLPSFAEPEAAPPPDTEDLASAEVRRTVERDVTTGETVYSTVVDLDEQGSPVATRLTSIELDVGHAIIERFRIEEDDPLSARAEVTHKTITRRGPWSVRIETRTRLSATADAFVLEAELEAHEGEVQVFRELWRRRVPRLLV